VLSSITSSKGDKEGIPVVLMEAQAVGMPVVSTLHSGIPEGVLDGKSGFLVPEKDIESLYEKIGYLIAHPEKWPELGRQGRSWVEKQFNQPVLDMELESIFEKLLKGKRCQS
jgi:colanic acid/amylovoran biosynthesis glycosyltransferase